MASITSGAAIPVSQRNLHESNPDKSKIDDKNRQIAKTALCVFSGLVLLAIGYQTIKLYNDKIFEDNFFNLLETDVPQAANIAKTCIGQTDEKCKPILRNAFPMLLNRSHYEAHMFARACIGQTDEKCQDVVKTAFSSLLSIDTRLAAAFASTCVGQTDENCQEVVNKAFLELLKKSPTDAAFFARSCIDKPDESCQEIVREALPHFLRQDLFFGANMFITDCIGHSDKNCEKAISEAYPIFLKEAPFFAGNIALVCAARNSCHDIIAKAYPQLLAIDLRMAESFVGRCSMWPDVEVCQQVVKDAAL